MRYESRGEIEKRDVDFVFDMLKNVFEQGPFEVMKAFVGGKDRSLLEDIFIMSEILRDFAVYEWLHGSTVEVRVRITIDEAHAGNITNLVDDGIHDRLIPTSKIGRASCRERV